MIHREDLASKTLPVRLRVTSTHVIKVVNYVKHSALNTRLFRQLVYSLRFNTPRSTVLHSGSLLVKGKYVRSGAGGVM